jgi:hypothetical protein
MTPDPIVDEVRRAREEYARRFNYDLRAIGEDLKRGEETSDRPVVDRSTARRAPDSPELPRGAAR